MQNHPSTISTNLQGNPNYNENDMLREIFAANKEQAGKLRDDFYVGGGNAVNILERHRDADDLLIEQATSPRNVNGFGLDEEKVLHKSESH